MTILFIDDDNDDTELFHEAVNYLNNSDFIAGRRRDITCLIAKNGGEALDLLSNLEDLPDCIFLDINMPLMGGTECLKQLKKTPRFSKIPVVMLSTTLRGRDLRDFKAMGAADCIVKPSAFKTLVKVLSKYVYNL